MIEWSPELCNKIIPIELSSEFKELELYALSDLHIGDPLCDVTAFRKFVKFVLAQENRYVIVNGDMANNAIKTSVSNIYNETIPPNEQRKWLVKELSPIKDRILCYVEGNHERRSKKDVDLSIAEWIADALGVRYYENFACLKIRFGKMATSKNGVHCGSGGPCAYIVFVTHGSSGGSLLGSALNKGERFISRIDGCDLLVLGHSHKKAAGKIGSLVCDKNNNQIHEVEKGIIVSSHWAAFGGYASRMMMPPSAKGCTWAILGGERKQVQIVL